MLAIVAPGAPAILTLSGDLTEWNFSADQFLEEATAAQAAGAPSITLRINSLGGSTMTANAIAAAIRSCPLPVTAEIMGVCASAATLVACSCSRVLMHADAQYMLHEPSFATAGTLAEIEASLKVLKDCRDIIYQVYSARTGKTPEELQAMLTQDRWLTAAEALEGGWVDEVLPFRQAAEPNPEPVAAVAEPTPPAEDPENPVDPEDAADVALAASYDPEKLPSMAGAAFASTARRAIQLAADRAAKNALDLAAANAALATVRAELHGAHKAAAAAQAAAVEASQNMQQKINAAVSAALSAAAPAADSLPLAVGDVPVRDVASEYAAGGLRHVLSLNPKH